MNAHQCRLELDREQWSPGETLTGRYWLTEESDQPLKIELHVGWQTEGKGTEDRHTFHQEVRTIPAWSTTDETDGQFAVMLPPTPLSYHGSIIKIIWSVCIKMAVGQRKRPEEKMVFLLGNVAAYREQQTSEPNS